MPREQPIIRVIPRLLDLRCWNSSGDHVTVKRGPRAFDQASREYICVVGCLALVAYEEWNFYRQVRVLIKFLLSYVSGTK